MNLPEFKALLTALGQRALESAAAFEPREQDFLADFQMLNKRYPSELARAALETAILRRAAQSKFPFSERMYFTREALEQASSWEISTYRAQRYRDFERIIDLGCSIGGDTLALASVVPTIGIDNDPLRLVMAGENLQNADMAANLLLGDLNHLPFSKAHSTGLFFDPARRAEQRRAFSVHDYSPPLNIIRDWLPARPALGVKISPGVKLAELSPYDAEIEFISLQGELKEAVLWFGPLKSASFRATLLPGPYTLTAESQPRLPISPPRAYLYEPDPAILRAGLVAALGAQLKAAQLDPEIAYLTADQLTETPFARAWEVEDWMPFQLKRLRAYLRERGVGQLVVKKRGSPLQPEELIQKLRLSGGESKTLFLTQLEGRPIVVICKAKPGGEA